MSHLSKNEIEKALCEVSSEERLFITPLLGSQVGSSSVDLRLGHQFIVTRRTNTSYVGPAPENPLQTRKAHERFYLEKGRQFFLHPGELVLGCTLEYLRLPRYLSGLVTSRSSWGRVGLVIATAVAVNPGYRGVITLELTNVGYTPIRMYPGLRIAQIIFNRLESPAEYSGKYDCLIGPEFSKLEDDDDLGYWMKR